MSKSLPRFLCGPFLRKCDADNVTIWYATSSNEKFDALLLNTDDKVIHTSSNAQSLTLGGSLIVQTHSIDVSHLNHGEVKGYRLVCSEEELTHESESQKDGVQKDALTDCARLCYGNVEDTSKVLRCSNEKNISSLLHGSCRKPHHESADSLVAIDNALATKLANGEGIPNYLIMSGDQIYADDVAGPMLIAIHSLARQLGLYSESLPPQADLTFDEVHSDKYLYKRHEVLPHYHTKKAFIFNRSEPIISSLYQSNHAITFTEFVCLYLLTWSSECWKLVYQDVLDAKTKVVKQKQALYQQELEDLTRFIEGIPAAERVMANVPSLMMFDDHDITDDWNLTAQWEQRILGNPLTKQIITNGLAAYAIFQGWGNDAVGFEQDWLPLFNSHITQNKVDIESINEALIDYNKWQFAVNTFPKIVMLDTRTQRWRSENDIASPSGLMDWESLSKVENILYEEKGSTILVSPAPVFGVKLIEVIQSLFAMCGQALLVDVENWMAHKGSAKKLLNMMINKDTPDELIVLSGDVHYSFCFSAMERFNKAGGKIWQLTSSGIKNEFPKKLLARLDRLNRMLYARKSIFNVFTKRRKLAIRHHKLSEGETAKGTSENKRLLSSSNIGVITFNEEGKLQSYDLLTSNGKTVKFNL